MLSREEIEGELRDVFAKMSDVELARELDGEWQELVEAEMQRRRAENFAPDAAADVGAAVCIAEAPTPSVEANWWSRIARFLRSILNRKSR